MIVPKNQVILVPSASEHIKKTIRAFLALLIDEEDHLFEQAIDITSNMLPEDMPRERLILDTLYECRKLGVPPTPSSIVAALEAGKKFENPGDYIKTCILPERPDDGAGVSALSSIIGNIWYPEARLASAIPIITKIKDDPRANVEEKHEQISRIIADIAPERSDTETMTQDQFVTALVKEQNQRAVNAKAGIANGPTLPWQAHKAYFANLDWGEITSIMGDTGYGKTTFMMEIAEHNAWKVPIYAHCHVISLETSGEKLRQRTFAKHALIPLDALRTGHVDFRQEKWAEKLVKFKELMGQRVEKSGEVKYHYVPSKKLTQVERIMYREAQASFAIGHSVIFFIDYLQKFEWQSVVRGDPTQAFEVIGERIAGITRTLSLSGNVHTVIMAQENPDTGEAFRTAVLRKISQMMFSIQRSSAISGQDIVMKSPSGEIMKDGMNQTRYWYKAGVNKYSHKIQLEARKENDAGGTHLDLLAEDRFYRIYQDQGQITKLKAKNLLS